jgi:small subunit ribosomal protein S4
MARYTGPSCRQCRREQTKLFLKGAKCLTEKCPVERRPYAPGQHGQSAGGGPGRGGRKTSEYAKQLREKQKVKRIYGLSETQFRNVFDRVTREPGVKGTNLLVALETRLDNVVHRMGFAASRKAARQLIRHGHIEVNGKKVDIPSFHVAPGMEVRVAPASRELVAVAMSLELASRGQPVSWLSVDREKAAGRLTERPTREAIPLNAQEQLIVELYSK